MNVLSLFDGMSCGQIALNRNGVKIDNYFASEIKPHAIEVTQHNYPNTIQLGDVRGVFAKDLPKIDILIGGSPCQDFSAANKERKGLQGVKSGLFYEYLRLLHELKPKYFLLENVAMDDVNYQTLSHLLGTFPVDINSSLVCGAYRQRSYWTNIGPFYNDMFGMRYCKIPQPKDKKISLQSVLESGYANQFKHNCLTVGGGGAVSQASIIKRNESTGMITVIYADETFSYDKPLRLINQREAERLQTVPDGYTSILNHRKAIDLLGDGWTVDVICHILKYMT